MTLPHTKTQLNYPQNILQDPLALTLGSIHLQGHIQQKELIHQEKRDTNPQLIVYHHCQQGIIRQ